MTLVDVMCCGEWVLVRTSENSILSVVTNVIVLIKLFFGGHVCLKVMFWVRRFVKSSLVWTLYTTLFIIKIK